LDGEWRFIDGLSVYDILFAKRIFSLNGYQCRCQAIFFLQMYCWLKVINSITQKLQSFINRCLRRIINVQWPDVISNIMLWETTGEKPTELQIKKRKWKGIGHTIRKDENAVERIALDWNPQGTKKRGRPKKTWRRSVMEEAQREGRTWREVKRLAAGRSR
jgi:hypothetical protein